MSTSQRLTSRLLLSVVFAGAAGLKITALVDSGGPVVAPTPPGALAFVDVVVAGLVLTRFYAGACWIAIAVAVGGSWTRVMADAAPTCGCTGNAAISAAEHMSLIVVVFGVASWLLLDRSKRPAATTSPAGPTRRTAVGSIR